MSVNLAINSIVVELSYEGLARQPDESRYTDDGGLIALCCHCLRTRRPSDPLTWDWVPGYILRQPARSTHTICEACMNLFYPSVSHQPLASKRLVR